MMQPQSQVSLPGASYQRTTDQTGKEQAWRRAWWQQLDWIAVALVAIGAGLRLWLMARGWPTLDSDEGVMGLMARHILYNGERPIFFYGQHYMGVPDAYAAAILFHFFGPSTFVLRLAVIPLTVGFLIAMYFLGKAAFGRAVGLITLTFLAFGPAYGLLRELAVIGGYQETLFFGAMIPLLIYGRIQAAKPQWSARKAWLTYYATYLLIGLLIGLGIWSDELILPTVILSLGMLLILRPRQFFGLAGIVILLGIIIGAAPFWAYNLGHGGQTFAELSHQQVATSGTGLAALASHGKAIAGQLFDTLSMAMPAVLGSPHVCVVPGSLYGGYASYPAQAASVGKGTLCSAINLLYSLLLLAIYLFALWQAIVRLTGTRSIIGWLRNISEHLFFWRKLGSDVSGGGVSSENRLPSAETAKQWLRVMLVLLAFATITEFVVTDHHIVSDRFVSARYLLPLYISLPIVFGTLWGWGAPYIRRIPGRRFWAPADGYSAGNHLPRDERQSQVRTSSRHASSKESLKGLLAAGSVAVLLAFTLLGAIESLATAADTSRYAFQASPADQRLIQELHALGIKRFYTDYWDCYDIAFESGEQLRCSLYEQADRYPPYATLLLATPNPAYVVPIGRAAGLGTTLAARLHQAGYQRIVFDGYTIYYLPGGQQNLP